MREANDYVVKYVTSYGSLECDGSLDDYTCSLLETLEKFAPTRRTPLHSAMLATIHREMERRAKALFDAGENVR